MIYVLVQIIIAIILIVLMGIVAYGIYNKNVQEILFDMLNTKNIRKKTKILDGYYTYKPSTSETFNTIDNTKGSYIDLRPSINEKGGAVYSYNFWLYIPEDAVPSNKTLVLFNKGLDRHYKFKNEDDLHCRKDWFITKNPLVRLNTNASGKISSIIVEFNSIESPDVLHINANSSDMECNGTMDQKDANLLGIKNLDARNDLKDKWNMITIVVSETSPDDNVFVESNQAIVKLYLNGYNYLDKKGELLKKSTAIKSNNAPFHIGTEVTHTDIINTDDHNISISDLTYFNYELEDEEIISLFKGGCNKSVALIPGDNTDALAYATEASQEVISAEDPEPL
jgi:hypothetical protein